MRHIEQLPTVFAFDSLEYLRFASVIPTLEQRPMLDVVMAGRPATKPAPLFGQRLAAARKEKGLTQTRFGELIGVSRELVDYYERRAPNPSLEFIQRAAEALGVEPGFFFEESEPQRRKKPGPPSEFEQRLEQLRRLPRSQQELILRMLDAALGPQTEVRE